MRIEVANSQFVVQRSTSTKESIPLELKDKGGSLSHRQSISQKRKAHQAKTYKGGLRKLGHPADGNPEKTITVRQKLGITNQNQNSEVVTKSSTT